MALCVTYGVAPAWAATFGAAKRPVFRTDERQHVSTAGSLAPSCGFAARRLRSANPFFRDLLMTLDRLCRYSLSLAFCAENAAFALHASFQAGEASLKAR